MVSGLIVKIVIVEVKWWDAEKLSAVKYLRQEHKDVGKC